MPANLTPIYRDAEARYKAAVTREEKIAGLEEMLRVIPKHKGTDRLQADLKRRLSKLQQTGQQQKKLTRRAPGEFVEREGAKQCLLIGGPNAGKSALVATLTHAEPEVAPYPYTTTRLAPGMMPFEDIQIELIDSPALSHEFARSWMGNQIRACDLILWVVSLGNDDLLTAVDETRSVLEQWHFELRPVEEGGSAPEPEPADPSTPRPLLARPTILIGTHADDPEAGLREELLLETLSDSWSPERVSATTKLGLDGLRRRIFESLDIVRVYTKAPGKKAEIESPYVLDAGSTVLDLAECIHKDIADGLKFARIWGQGQYDGQHVQRDHVLADRDVVELHN